jgi:hypothetical protein
MRAQREEQAGGGDEADGVALLVALEPRRDERPQLEEPDRGRQHGAGDQADLQPQQHAAEHVEDDQPAALVAL